MKLSRNSFQLIAFLLLCGLSVSAQTAASDAKEFNKDGLTFNYPSGWSCFRPDNAVTRATPAWDMIRSTIKIAGPTPQVKPSPKPAP